MNEQELFSRGISNAVQTCMNVTGDDRILVTTDQITKNIGQALAREARKQEAEVDLVYLEDYGTRPLTEAPSQMVEDVVNFQPTVTFFAASGQQGEVKMRMGSTLKIKQALEEREIPLPRRAHMIGITEKLIREGMNADYREVHNLTMKVTDLLEKSEIIRVTSQKGSDLKAVINPNYNWVPCHGLYHQQGEGGNLPEGEVFTCPGSLNGVIVADVLGDYFSTTYGVLKHPVTFKVEDGKVEQISCSNQNLVEELWEYLQSAENGLRVGEFAIGTNTAVQTLSGNLLQDEKIPGVHIAFGNPIGHETGAEWTSDVHIDVIPTDCTIQVDGKLLLEGRTFHLD